MLTAKHFRESPNMKTILLTLTLSAAAVLTACAATGNDYVPGAAPGVLSHPVLGELKPAERSLLGPDADSNGIRDDIDRLVGAPGAPGAARERSHYALQYTRAMLAGARGARATAAEAAELKAAAAALDEAAGPNASTTLAARIASTPARQAAFVAWQQQQ